MHSDLALYLYLAIAAGFAFAFGWLGCAIIAGRRERLDALELAERADVNGQRLLVIARGLRDTPAPAEHRHDLDRWAGMLEDIARAHLECINAIGLEAMHQVNPAAPVHLGDFVPARPGSNPPPPSGRKPTPPANPPAAYSRYWQDRAMFWRDQAIRLGWRELASAASGDARPPGEPPSIIRLARRAVPFLRDEGTKFEDDGSNEPLELAREIEAALQTLGVDVLEAA